MILTGIAQFVKTNWKDLTLAILVFLAIFISFGLGYLAAQYQTKEPIEINYALYYPSA